MARAAISVMRAALLLVTGCAIQDDAARGRTIMRHDAPLDAAEDSGTVSSKGAGASEAFAEQSAEHIVVHGDEVGRDVGDAGGRGESHNSVASDDRPDVPPGQRGRGRGPDGNGPPGQRGRGRGPDGKGPPGHQGKGRGKDKRRSETTSRDAGTKNKKRPGAREIKSQESPGGVQTKTNITIITKAEDATTTTPASKGLFGGLHLPFSVPSIFGRSQPPATTTTTLPPAATLPNGTMTSGGDQTKAKITIITRAEDSAATQETVATTTTTTTPTSNGLFGGMQLPFSVPHIFGSSQPPATTTTTTLPPPAATLPNGTMTLQVFVGDSCDGMAILSMMFDYLPDFRACGACFPSNSGHAVKVCDAGGALRTEFYPGSSCEVATLSGDIASMEGCVQLKDQPVRLALNGTGAFRVDAMEFCKCPGAAL